MKSIIVFSIILFSVNVYSQDTTLITKRGENIPLQAVLDVEGSKILYAGQEYTFALTTSGNYDIRLTAKNAKVKLIENSKKSTGGFRYTITPIDTGTCSITIGNQIDEKRSVSLKMQMFQVVSYPIPPIQINGVSSGEIIKSIGERAQITCSYPKETGINENYEISKWKATVGDQSFSGTGSVLSEELVQYIKRIDNEYMYLMVDLYENKTNHFKSEGIYLIKKN